MSDSSDPPYLALTATIISAHISNNAITADALPDFIRTVYQTLANVGTGSAAPITTSDKLAPAVPVKKSVMPDYIICLEDGKRMKMLKRHLQTAYGLTPDQYRER